MIMHALGNVYSNRIQGDSSENQKRAIDYHNLATEIWAKDVVPMKWASSMYGLGNA